MNPNKGTSILFYWQDAWLPQSRFILDAFVSEQQISKFVAAGPATRENIPAIFTAGKNIEPGAEGGNGEERTRCYRSRDTICTFGEWRRLIRRYRPDLVLVADEALSVNVLLAGLANRLYGHGAVFFYGFENIKQGIGWRTFWTKPTPKNLKRLVQKALRFLFLDKLMMTIRPALVHGGLVSYEECIRVIHAWNWRPPMQIKWWPVDIGTFKSSGPKAEFGLRTGFVVGFVGRFVAEKGITSLLRAMAQLDADYGLVLIGQGPEKGAMEREILALGLADRVRILPPQDAETLAKSYRAMNLLILPSIPSDTWKEQFGRVLAEARSCGTPVAGSDSGAIPTVVGDSRMVFPAGDSAAMAAVIRRARTSGPMRPETVTHPDAAGFVKAWLLLAEELRGAGYTTVCDNAQAPGGGR
jgi:glycosyltransferase involved in cell wall biosynthesis